MKVHIICEMGQLPIPGTMNHLAAMFDNPNNRNMLVEVISEEDLKGRMIQ